MVKLTNDDENLAIDKDFVASYFKTKSTNCIIYSEDGDEFKIHKEVLSQTKVMRNILKSAANCCNIIEIFCPCPKVTIIQVGLRMTSRLAGLIFTIQKGSVKHKYINPLEWGA